MAPESSLSPPGSFPASVPTAFQMDNNKILDSTSVPSAMLVVALVESTRAALRAKQAEIAALKRLEQSLLTIQKASLPDDINAPPQQVSR